MLPAFMMSPEFISTAMSMVGGIAGQGQGNPPPSGGFGGQSFQMPGTQGVQQTRPQAPVNNMRQDGQFGLNLNTTPTAPGGFDLGASTAPSPGQFDLGLTDGGPINPAPAPGAATKTNAFDTGMGYAQMGLGAGMMAKNLLSPEVDAPSGAGYGAKGGFNMGPTHRLGDFMNRRRYY
jgi:hypothetical protein